MVINGYNIINEIHRGPITTVYSAEHVALGRKVLLKILNAQWQNEKDLIERFRREAKICARLEHPNIVNIFDFGTDSDVIFISMEYIEGYTLEQYFSTEKKRNFSDILNITTQILKGLSYAHRQGAIHRDIKPSNIMISHDGQVKITDFGMATISDLPQITGNGQVVGSPAFMSPEQALGKELGHRSDLFSLGATLYTLCSGKSPFEADNLGATIQNILTAVPASLKVNQNEIPDWFADIIGELLSKDPQNRPESADTVLNMLDKKSRPENHEKSAQPTAKLAQIVTRLKNPTRYSATLFWVFPVISLFALLLFWPSGEKLKKKDQQDIITQIRPPAVNNPINQEGVYKQKPDDQSVTRNYPEPAKGVNINSKRDIGTFKPVQEAASAPVQVPKSRLFIIANPWADVFIDSIYFDTTPLNKELILNPGDHIIELKNPNYVTFIKNHSLEPAQSETLLVNLELKVGFLDVRVLPWAEVYIDDEYQATTPLAKPVPLMSGEHIVSLVNPNYKTITDTVKIIAGKILNKRFNFLK